MDEYELANLKRVFENQGQFFDVTTTTDCYPTVFYYVQAGKHYFTDLDQMLEYMQYVKANPLMAQDFYETLKTTIEMGYKLTHKDDE